MAFRRGGIYVANFNPSKGTEPGKLRPCLIMQSNLLNDVEHPSTTILPLTTRLTIDAAPLRFHIKARDKLHHDSDIMIDQTRTLDNRRLSPDPLTWLSEAELFEVEAYWRIVLGLED